MRRNDSKQGKGREKDNAGGAEKEEMRMELMVVVTEEKRRRVNISSKAATMGSSADLAPHPHPLLSQRPLSSPSSSSRWRAERPCRK